jgi:tetraacyldisaccharide 4'-kinase
VLVIDERGFGNGHCLPYGPLREPAIQLTRFDTWVNNGLQIAHPDGLGPLPRLSAPLTQVGSSWVPLTAWQTPERWLSVDDGIAQLRGRRILAVAGIAKPEQFFQSLRDMGLAIETLPLADHDPELASRIEQQLQLTHYDHVLMTEKDAVKFFSTHRTLPSEAWALRRDAQCDSEFIQRMIHGPKTP